MKKYLPVLIAIAIVIASIFFVRQFRKMQEVIELPSLTETTPSEGVSRVATSPSPVSRVAGISLSVSVPANNTTVSVESISVRGKTVPGAEVFVNDGTTVADASGNFSVTISLDEGENYILVVVNDALGNYSEKELTVTYAP